MAEDWQYVDKKYFWTTLKILCWGWWWWWQHQWKQDVTRPSCQHQGSAAPRWKEDFPRDPTLSRLASWCPAILASESFNIDIISGQFRCNFLFRLEDKMQKNRNYKIQLFVHTSRPILFSKKMQSIHQTFLATKWYLWVATHSFHLVSGLMTDGKFLL